MTDKNENMAVDEELDAVENGEGAAEDTAEPESAEQAEQAGEDSGEDEDAADDADRDELELKGLFEAVLFLSNEPVPIQFFVKNFSLDPTQAKIIMDTLVDDYEERDGGIHLVEIANGFQFVYKRALCGTAQARSRHEAEGHSFQGDAGDPFDNRLQTAHSPCRYRRASRCILASDGCQPDEEESHQTGGQNEPSGKATGVWND